MDLQPNDKHVLITGSSRGVGLACALAFLDEGASVTLIARDAGRLETARLELTDAFPASCVHGIAADLTKGR